MYLTAHRVQSKDGQQAIHVFLHAHPDQVWPRDVSAWPETRPGEITRHQATLPIGGNRVRAYLDILCPEGTEAAVVRGALEALEQDLKERINPTVMKVGNVTMRFGVELALEDRRTKELLELAKSAMELWHQKTA